MNFTVCTRECPASRLHVSLISIVINIVIMKMSENIAIYSLGCIESNL